MFDPCMGVSVFTVGVGVTTPGGNLGHMSCGYSIVLGRDHSTMCLIIKPLARIFLRGGAPLLCSRNVQPR